MTNTNTTANRNNNPHSARGYIMRVVRGKEAYLAAAKEFGFKPTREGFKAFKEG